MTLFLPILDTENIKQLCELYKTENDENVIRDLVYKGASQVLFGKIKSETFVGFLENLSVDNVILINIYLDVLNVLDIESTVNADKPELRVNFIDLLVHSNGKLVTEWALKERLEYSTIEEAKIINNSKQLTTKFVKLKTKLFYKQKKYNLFREESEGFSKFITAIFEHSYDSPEMMLRYMKSLIGNFNLDPNRALDLILEGFENDVERKDFYIKLINLYFDYIPRDNVEEYSNDIVTSIMSKFITFKFNFYNSEDCKDTVPDGLYDIAALLITNRLGKLSELESLLSPDDDEIFEIYNNEIELAKKFAARINLLMEEGVKPQDISVFENERSRSVSSNQRLGLINSFIKFGDWKHAEKMIQSMPEYFAVSYPEIALRLCHLIEYLIDPLYRKNSLLPDFLKCRLSKFKSHLDVEQVDNYLDFQKEVSPLIFQLGPYIFRNPLLISKLLRIFRTEVEVEKGSQKSVMRILMVSIMPSFALLETNPPLVEELWSLMLNFHYSERYFLYNFWKQEPTIPLFIKKKIQVTKRIKYIMKRISSEKDVIKSLGRTIGKLTFSFPTLIFDYILDKIQQYDNMIVPVVDSLRYLGTIFFDVLSFCTIELLTRPMKELGKEADGNIAQWLLSVANFTSLIAKRYFVELQGILQFVANQLKMGKCYDMIVLKEVVTKMTGIEIADDVTIEQLDALSGGDILKSEASMFNQVRNMKRSTQKLKDALLEDDLAASLCILMGQQRVAIAYQNDGTHLKLVGKLYDQCQDTLVQFGYFLADNLTIDDYIHRMPAIEALFGECKLKSDVAFFLARPRINHEISSKFVSLSKGIEKGSPKLWPLYGQSANEVLRKVVSAVNPLLQKQKINLNAELFATFWSMSMYDLKVPDLSYKREQTKIQEQIQRMEQSEDMSMSKNRKERERLLSKIVQFKDEAEAQHDHTDRVLKRLEQESKTYFQEVHHKMVNTTNFIQHCLFPRCKFTPLDAIYCAKFVHLLHCLKTPNFSTLLCFDKIFSDIMCVVASLTQNEANNYGRFLLELMKIAMHWHKDIGIYNDECADFPGVVTKFSEQAAASVDYENFRHICHKWHFRIAKSVIACFESGEYILIRNALIVLTRLLPVFPKIKRFYEVMEIRIEKIQQNEKKERQDLYILATGYLGQMNQRKHTLVKESDFHDSKRTDSAKAKSKEVKRDIEEVFDENSKSSVTKEDKQMTAEAGEIVAGEKRTLDKIIEQTESEPKLKESKIEVLDTSSKHSGLKKRDDKDRNNRDRNKNDDMKDGRDVKESKDIRESRASSRGPSRDIKESRSESKDQRDQYFDGQDGDSKKDDSRKDSSLDSKKDDDRKESSQRSQRAGNRMEAKDRGDKDRSDKEKEPQDRKAQASSSSHRAKRPIRVKNVESASSSPDHKRPKEEDQARSSSQNKRNYDSKNANADGRSSSDTRRETGKRHTTRRHRSPNDGGDRN